MPGGQWLLYMLNIFASLKQGLMILTVFSDPRPKAFSTLSGDLF